MSDFQRILQRIREGSQEAAWDLIEQYSPQVLRVVRRRLPEQLRSKFDSHDFVQAAWASVFAHRSRLVRFSQPQQFIAFMAAVARNKVGMEIRRRLGSQNHTTRHERLLEEMPGSEGQPRDAGQATPSQIAVARERWFQLMNHQPAHYRQFIQLRFAGVTYREIAERLGYDESTVRRAIRRILREQEL